ncbi:lipase maturation factor family protein [Thiolapillus sp.]
MYAYLTKLFQPRSEFQLASRIFLKALALIYLAAFASLAVQIAGLAGPDGILPFGRYLANAWQALGYQAWVHVPTLFWFNASDAALQGVAWAGVAFSLLLLWGRWPVFSLIMLFVLYLSLYRAGQVFMNFQWDTLLLEAGLLGVFLQLSPTALVLFLYHWLLFRLRFMSGFFKLATGDPAWANLTTLDYYFETQPLPHVGAWYAHQLPQWLHRFGTGFTFFTELLVPFFIFLPRPFRLAAVAITLFMQGLILATSNHNFFNLLTIALCILLLDDKAIRWILRKKNSKPTRPLSSPGPGHRMTLSVLALLLLFASITGFYTLASGRHLPLESVRQLVQGFGVGAIYHVFPTMQTERQELIVEGSHDGKQWQEYVFRYKPQMPGRTPAFIVPHQPRLDWMMWFVPTQHPVQMYWFGEFIRGIKRGSGSILALLEKNPFPDAPPEYLRVTAWRYRFSTPEERGQTGDWWQRQYLGVFPFVTPRKP